MTIQLHRLEGFYWVAKEGGYAAAARAFPYPITQPGVHHQVKKLEADLGAPLFQRVGKDQLKLTAAGQVLFEFCSPFFEGLSSAVAEALSSKGILRIAAGELETCYFLPSWINRLREGHPDLQVRLRETRHVPFEDLRTGKLDLIVDYIDALPKDCAARSIGQHHFFAIFAESLPAPTDPIALLSEHDFITFEAGTRERRFQLGGLSAAGVTYKVGGTASSVAGILGLVEAGLGVSVIPWPNSEGPCRRGVAQIAVPLPERYDISAVYLKSRGDDEDLLSYLSAD